MTEPALTQPHTPSDPGCSASPFRTLRTLLGTRFGGPFFVVLCALALVNWTSTAFAQPGDAPEGDNTALAAPPATTAAAAISESHGWMTIRDDRDQSTILLHLPPRTGGSDTWGAVRIAPGVAQQIDAIAFEGDRVWLAVTPERGVTGMLRRIVTLSATRSIGGAWEYPPGRPEVLPPLIGRDELIGFAGTARGAVALTRSRPAAGEAPGVADWNLHILQGSAWHALSLPWLDAEDLPAAGTTVRLVGMGPSIGLMVFPASPGPVELLQADLPVIAASDPTEAPALAMSWLRESWPVVDLKRPEGGILAPDSVYLVGDGRARQLVAASWMDTGVLELVALRASGASLLKEIEGVPREHRIAPLSSNGSIAALWWEVAGRDKSASANGAAAAEPVPGSTAARRFIITEVSALSGKEFYRGPTEGGGLISGNEFKLLAIGLLLLTTLVLLFALRAEPTATLQLPGVFAPADPLRRIVAAAADLVPGVVIAAFSMGLEPEAMLSPTIFIGPSAEPMAWLLALAFTILHCTAGETMTGKSIGKALAGCEVASLRRDRETGKIELGPVQFWQALTRNLIRWGVPVLGILLLIDGGRRHPADAAARTVVVVRLEDPETDQDD